MKRPLRQLTALLLGAGSLLAGAPGQALEQIQLSLPFLQTPFTIDLKELRDQRSLLSGDSDLAELDRAMDGAIGRKLVQAFQAPLPLPVKAFAQQSVGSPLVNQVLLLLSSVVLVEGVRQPMDSKALAASLATSQAKGKPSASRALQGITSPRPGPSSVSCATRARSPCLARPSACSALLGTTARAAIPLRPIAACVMPSGVCAVRPTQSSHHSTSRVATGATRT